MTVSFLCKAFASGLFVSHLPVAYFKRTFWTGAGLLGALWGLILLPLTPTAPLPYAVFLVATNLLAVPIATVAGRAYGLQDDPRIIIDETAGFWTSVAFLPRDTYHLAAAFILFRLFDVYKLPAVRRLEKLPGGWGVILDDTAAGILTCLLLHAADQVRLLLRA